MPGAVLLRVLLGCERRGEGGQVAECAGSADVVRVVAGFDDHAVTDPGDEDVRDQDRPIAGRSLVAELGDDNLGIPCPVHVQADGLETLNPVCAGRRLGEVAAQVRRDATLDEVYLLVRSLAQASAAMPVPPDTQRRAIEVILAGLASPASR